MTEAEWLACTGGDDWRTFTHDMQACLQGKGSIRKLRLFAFACCHHIDRSRIDPRSLNALEVAERALEGWATDEELRAAIRISHRVLDEHLRLLAELGELSKEQAEPQTAANVINWAISNLSSPSETSLCVCHAAKYAQQLGDEETVRRWQAGVLCDILGEQEPLPILTPSWLTSDVLALATGIYDSRDFCAMPILADALQDAGCDCDDILNHFRDPNATHVRGCWALDLILGKS
jgi:hypothetical protein